MSRQSSLYSIILALHPMSTIPTTTDNTKPPYPDFRIRDLSIVWTDYHGEKELGEAGELVVGTDKHSLTLSPNPVNKGLESEQPLRTKPGRSASTSSTSASSSYELDPPPALRQTSGITELGPGIIHLYKHARPLSLLESLEANAVSPSKPSTQHVENAQNGDSGSSTPEGTESKAGAADGEDGTLIAILAVPGWMEATEFREWLGGWNGCLEGFRMISDQSPNKTIVLLKFKEPQEANDFVSIYTGKTFSSEPSRPETCHPIRIHHLLMHRLPPPTAASSPASLPHIPVPKTPNAGLMHLLVNIPQRTIHELPTCPICLERMDSAVTGLITTPCSHVGKCRCLSKWGESECPVCRYAHRGTSRTKPTNGSHGRDGESRWNGYELDNGSATTPFTRCLECTETQNDPKANWICVICDYIGCSRYQRGHARDHFMRSGHAYSMEIETQRVWDYMEDNYVHRLIRTRADGKLVELPSAASLASNSAPDSRRGSLLLGEKHNHTSAHSRLSSSSATWSGNFGPSLSDEKKIARLEDLTLEYSYLLSAQLEQQRQHYEIELVRAKEEAGEFRRRAHEGEVWRKRFVIEEERRKEVERKLERDGADQARLSAVRKADVASELARKLQADLSSEQSLTSGLLSRVSLLETALSDLQVTHASCPSTEKIAIFLKARRDLAAEKEKTAELEEMIKDLMFSLEARDKIEAAGGGEDGGLGGDLKVVAPVTIERGEQAAGDLDADLREGVDSRVIGLDVAGSKKKKKKKR